MPSVSNFQTALEGTLVTQISAAATTATVKVKKINGATPTWLTTAHRVTIIQKSRTVTKVEVVDVAAGTTQSGTTVTLGTMTRGLPLDGTGFTGSGTPQVFTSGAKVIVTWDAQAGRQTAFKDIANSFSATQTITSTNELRFADSATAIWDDGTNLSFKDSTTATKTLAQLSALSGSDEKVKITATDTTSSYLDDAILVTSPITKTTNSGGANETLTIALDTVPVTKGGTGIITGSTAYAPIFTGTTATGAFQAGTAGTANQVLTSNGAAALPTFQDIKTFMKPVFLSGVTSTTLTNPTAATDFDTHTYTIPANNLITGVIYKFSFATTVTHGTSGTYRVGLELGGTEAAAITLSAATGTAYTIFEGTIMGTAAASASSAVRVHIKAMKIDGAPAVVGVAYAAANFATNGDLAITFTARFGTSDGGNTTAGLMSEIWKSSTTAF